MKKQSSKAAKNLLIKLLDRLPYIRGLKAKNLKLTSQLSHWSDLMLYPPGHFYSPVVSRDDIIQRTDTIWPVLLPNQINAIDLNTQFQLSFLKENLGPFYAEMPFKADKVNGLRYYFNNGNFTHSDGILLYSMIRALAPKRIVEIGSGFSSALMLDTNEHFMNESIHLTFIEPYPVRLYENIGDIKPHVQIIESMVQDVSLDVFENLQSGDILFVDSTHVVKTGSDVNYIVFEILPRLKPGVIIHFHDVFYPFEYPKKWVLNGWNWNEGYFLRSFLMFNNQFEILLFGHYLHTFYPECFESMPITKVDTGGSLWLKKR